MTNQPQSPSRVWRYLRWTLIALAGFATLAVLFRTVENWRGKRAWEQCRRELEANGAVFKWDAYIPPAVPDDQNVFNAPKMTEWFVGRGMTELSDRLANPKTSSVGSPTNEIQTV